MQNLLQSVRTLRDEGKIYFGVGSGKIGLIDSRDIADAAIAAATSETWDGETLELTGPAAIDYFAVASAIGKELGREITYIPVPPAAVGEAARRHGADEWTANATVEFCAAYAKGWGDFATDAVMKVTGHAPRSISDFAREVLVPALRGP
jgi:NAD(P)H dehydrogenase (quinone)